MRQADGADQEIQRRVADTVLALVLNTTLSQADGIMFIFLLGEVSM